MAGPPCAGKNTYVAERRRPGDLVLDVDALHMALTGLPSHEHRQGVLPFVYEARDAVMAKVAEGGSPPVWAINGAPRVAERNRWRSLYGANVVLLVPDPDECHRRADVAGRPREWHGYIDNWFNRYEPDGTVI